MDLTTLTGGVRDLPKSKKTATISIVDCAKQFTLPADKLKLLTVVGLDNSRVVETALEEFTFVLYSGNGFQI